MLCGVAAQANIVDNFIALESIKISGRTLRRRRAL